MVKVKLYKYVLYRMNERYYYEKIYEGCKLQNALQELDNILRCRAKTDKFEGYEAFMKDFERRIRYCQEDHSSTSGVTLDDGMYKTDKDYLWEIHSAQSWTLSDEYHHEIETSVLGASGQKIGATRQKWMLNVSRL